MVDQVISFGKPPPLLVLTGGDPMWRRDLEELVRYASERGVSVALTPSGTAAARRDRLAALQAAGLTRVAVSLDGPDPTSHDDFRRVRGSFKWTMRIIESAIALGMPLQVNSTVTRRTLPLFEQMVETVCGLPLALWAVFFLVPTGRGVDVDQIEPAECERVLQRLCELTRVVPFGIKTTEAPHFRRVMAEQAKGGSGRRVPGRLPLRLRSTRGVNDGNGFVFVDHRGQIYPSGFLPLALGDARDGTLVSTYRDHPTFRRLRDPEALTGRCGRCEYRALCGGSRSRAYAETGDPLASDPLCAYDPGPDAKPSLQPAAPAKRP